MTMGMPLARRAVQDKSIPPKPFGRGGIAEDGLRPPGIPAT
jgi:hypothetical protein